MGGTSGLKQHQHRHSAIRRQIPFLRTGTAGGIKLSFSALSFNMINVSKRNPRQSPNMKNSYFLHTYVQPTLRAVQSLCLRSQCSASFSLLGNFRPQPVTGQGSKAAGIASFRDFNTLASASAPG